MAPLNSCAHARGSNQSDGMIRGDWCFFVWGLRAMFMVLEGFGGIGFLCYYQFIIVIRG